MPKNKKSNSKHLLSQFKQPVFIAGVTYVEMRWDMADDDDDESYDAEDEQSNESDKEESKEVKKLEARPPRPNTTSRNSDPVKP